MLLENYLCNLNESIDHTKPPYIRKIDQRGDIEIWSVDGSYVRGHIDEEFTNFSQHFRFNFIPLTEFWIDAEGTPDEIPFFIEHLLVEFEEMRKGASYSDALTKADKAEREERRKAGDVNKITKGGSILPTPEMFHTRLWKTLENGLEVWIVDGRLIRSVLYNSFTAGGHFHVYEFVPQNEIWIDNDIQFFEMPYVLLHELHEFNRMEQGIPYSKAHEESSKLEFYCRHHPDELHDKLAEEGWT